MEVQEEPDTRFKEALATVNEHIAAVISRDSSMKEKNQRTQEIVDVFNQNYEIEFSRLAWMQTDITRMIDYVFNSMTIYTTNDDAYFMTYNTYTVLCQFVCTP